VVAVFAFTLACGGGGGGGGQPSSAAQMPALSKHVDVTFWHALSANLEKALTSMTDQFNSSQSLVTVKLVNKGAYNELRKALLTSLAAGSPPDMAQCIENHGAEYVKSNALADLAPYLDAKDGLSKEDKNDIYPIMLKSGQINGKQYMMPFNKSTVVLYYNKDMLAAKGITKAPDTWDDYFTAAQAVTDPAAGRWGSGPPPLDMWISGLYEYGGQLYDSTNAKDVKKGTFNSAAAQGWTQKWVDAIGKGYVKPVSGPNFPDQTDFTNGKTAFYMASQVSYQFITGPIGTKFKFGEAPIPSGSSGRKDILYGANGCVFSKSSQDVQHGAMLYMKYFTNTENTATWAQKSSYMPVRQSATKSLQGTFYTQNPDQGVGIGMVGNLFLVPFIPTYEDQRTKITTELDNIWAKRKDVKKGLDDAVSAVNDTLATA
jgi:multiple sugar transport system substrate-binding protein